MADDNKTADGGAREAQADRFVDAVRSALNAENVAIAGDGHQPSIYAVMQALATVFAEFVALEPSQGRRNAILAESFRNIEALIQLRVSVGGKQAKAVAAKRADDAGVTSNADADAGMVDGALAFLAEEANWQGNLFVQQGSAQELAALGLAAWRRLATPE